MGSAIDGGEQVGRLGARVDVPADLWQDFRTIHREGVLEAAVSGVGETVSVAWLTLRMIAIGAALVAIHTALHLAIDCDYLARRQLPPERARSGH